eukprot:CAMPEP_0114541932 /NCGR_PEP_ID=MMETSP0114-20121206/1568_1 /TAXON_ID=31324 /ORGANISM="Goniomonas sp, Strain m" /LENGTH=97 /DNA_ID=CAMNT_0001726201 /DNA_START=752 /DNA_END=1045 /DNA_ORIENTATION=+
MEPATSFTLELETRAAAALNMALVFLDGQNLFAALLDVHLQEKVQLAFAQLAEPLLQLGSKGIEQDVFSLVLFQATELVAQDSTKVCISLHPIFNNV